MLIVLVVGGYYIIQLFLEHRERIARIRRDEEFDEDEE